MIYSTCKFCDETHVCVYDRNGICTDQTRDWCNVCNRCTVWDGEVCTGCGAVWGEA